MIPPITPFTIDLLFMSFLLQIADALDPLKGRTLIKVENFKYGSRTPADE
jgi:hypothetical protein